MENLKSKRGCTIAPSQFKLYSETRKKLMKMSQVVKNMDSETHFLLVIPTYEYELEDGSKETGPLYVTKEVADLTLSLDGSAGFGKVSYSEGMYSLLEDGTAIDTTILNSYRHLLNLLQKKYVEDELASMDASAKVKNLLPEVLEREKAKFKAKYSNEAFTAFCNTYYSGITDEKKKFEAGRAEVSSSAKKYLTPPYMVAATMGIIIPATPNSKIDPNFTLDNVKQVYVKVNNSIRLALEKYCEEYGTDKGYITLHMVWKKQAGDGNNQIGINIGSMYKQAFSVGDIGLSDPAVDEKFKKALDLLIRDPEVVRNKISELNGKSLEDTIQAINAFLINNANTLSAINVDDPEFKRSSASIMGLSQATNKFDNTTFLARATELSGLKVNPDKQDEIESKTNQEAKNQEAEFENITPFGEAAAQAPTQAPTPQAPTQAPTMDPFSL